MVQKTVVIIPARGGSKGIPKKNIITFCGKPLLAWTILQARQASLVDEVYVSTNDHEIGSVALRYGAKVIWRPEDISGDTARSEDALRHAVTELEENGIRIKYVVFLQATSPLREAADIDRAIRTIEKEKADSLFSGAEAGDLYMWRKENGKLQSINYDYKSRKRRQDYGTQYLENGSIYIVTPKALFMYNNRFGATIALSLMEFWKSFEVDEYEDIAFCSMIFKTKGLHKKK